MTKDADLVVVGSSRWPARTCRRDFGPARSGASGRAIATSSSHGDGGGDMSESVTHEGASSDVVWMTELEMNICWRLAEQQPVGRVAFIHRGRPMVLPVNHVTDDRARSRGLPAIGTSGSASSRRRSPDARSAAVAGGPTEPSCHTCPPTEHRAPIRRTADERSTHRWSGSVTR